jgi:hypothetical protein
MSKKIRPPLPWTETDREILKIHYPHTNWSEILDMFPQKRSWYECMIEAERLGIQRLVNDFEKPSIPKNYKRNDYENPVFRWTEEDREIIRRLYPKDPKHTILAVLSWHTWHAIQKEASRLKIKRKVRDAKDDP